MVKHKIACVQKSLKVGQSQQMTLVQQRQMCHDVSLCGISTQKGLFISEKCSYAHQVDLNLAMLNKARKEIKVSKQH